MRRQITRTSCGFTANYPMFMKNITVSMVIGGGGGNNGQIITVYRYNDSAPKYTNAQFRDSKI